MKLGEIVSGERICGRKRLGEGLPSEQVAVDGLNQGSGSLARARFQLGAAFLILVRDQNGGADDSRQQAG